MKNSCSSSFSLASAAFVAYALLRPDDPVTTAKMKCEFSIERAPGYDVPILEVSRASVSGDVFDGTVRMPFISGEISHLGECVFRDGGIGRITVDGKPLARRP